MIDLETNARKIISELEAEDWVNVGGGSHTKFTHSDKPGMIMVLRHKEVSPGVAGP